MPNDFRGNNPSVLVFLDMMLKRKFVTGRKCGELHWDAIHKNTGRDIRLMDMEEVITIINKLAQNHPNLHIFPSICKPKPPYVESIRWRKPA